MTHTDQLTARQLLEIFLDTVTVKQMQDKAYQDALILLKNAPSDQEFTVRKKSDQHLITWCLNYTPKLFNEVKPDLFETLANIFRP